MKKPSLRRLVGLGTVLPPAFWRWFGTSVVLDVEGRPKVVYHGTPERGFDAFEPACTGWRSRGAGMAGPALYFTDSLSVARGYTEGGSRKAVLRVYLRIENPLMVDAEGVSWTNVFPEVVQQARREGQDGVIVQNVRDTARSWDEEVATTYVVFDAKQVKHAAQNRGTFDRADVRFSFNRVGSRGSRGR